MTIRAEGGEQPDVVRRAVRDGAWNAAALIVPGVANLLVVAYLFRSLGPAGFAPWALVVAVLGLLTILDAGLSATTARNAARALAGDPEGARLVRAAFTAYAGLAVAVIALGWALTTIVPAVLGSRGGDGRAAVATGIVLALDLAVVIGTGGWLGALRGARRFDLLFGANVVQVLIALPATLWLVPWLGLPGAALAQLAGRLGGRLVAARALSRVVPWIRLRPGRVPGADLRRLGLFALPILAIAVSTQLGVGSDPIVVALVAGPAAVGLYAAGSGLARYAAFLLFPMLAVLLPSFSELSYARPASVAPIVLRCVRLAGAIGVIAFGTLAVTAGPVLEAWIGRAEPLSVSVLVIYAIAHAAWTPSQVLILALIATGRHGLVGATLLADAVLNVGLSVALGVAVGPIGVAISSVILLVGVHGIAIPIIAARRLDLPGGVLAASLAGAAAAGGVVVALIGLVPAGDPIGFLVRAAIGGSAILALLAVDHRLYGRQPSGSTIVPSLGSPASVSPPLATRPDAMPRSGGPE